MANSSPFRCGMWLALLLTIGFQAASADEGMWLFNDLPRELLKQKYGFEPTDAWADHIMRSSVRFNSGGSGSFVSSGGLVLTNHHVGADTLHKLSDANHDFYQDGFLAKNLADERPAPDLELNQLVSIEDVTKRVEAAVKPGASASDAAVARRAVMAEIEKASLEETGLRSDVVTLFGGGRYHLYRYKKYTDVRLVWSPEAAIAFFGGDADNFEYPRYCLDVCLFRVYEDGKPAKIDNFLTFSKSGAKDGELVFVSGHPGRTSRIYTVAALKLLRDARVPYALNYLRRLEVLYQQYGLAGEEQERRVKDDLFSMQNSRKAYNGMLLGLQDPELMAGKERAEKELLARVKDDPKLQGYADAWDQITQAQSARSRLLGQRLPFRSRLYQIALTLVQMAAEDQLPSPKRLRDYRDSARESLEQSLYSAAPIYPDLEQVKLADELSLLAERLGGDHPLVRKALNGKSPAARAAELVSGTRLADVATRRSIASGGEQAIKDSTDPMIALARIVDPTDRRVRKQTEEQVDEVERQAYARIAEVLFATQGTSTYPDATFTLRLAFGTVKGYVENGREIPPWTTIGGAFQHEASHDGKSPWELPASWNKHKNDLKLNTPLNFVSTTDIIGGNSGSPVVNRQGELVGVIFDSNIHGLMADYIYTDKLNRAVSVHSSAIREALRSVYGAGSLAEELGK